MTKWLVQTFIKDHEETDRPAVRTAYGQLSGAVGIVCNVLLFTIKLIVGTVSGSVAVTADAVNNLSDASSNIISFLGFKMASRPADAEHPYGHGRYEYLSGLMVALLIMVVGFELLKSGISKIMHPEPVSFSWVMAGALVFSILVKLWMLVFNRRMGSSIHSETLIATAADSRNDVIATGAVLLAMGAGQLWGVALDGWMGVAVAVFVLVSGFNIVKDTLDPLLGKMPEPELVDYIRNKILSYPGVLGTHDLMIHDYGPGRQFASVHVEMAAEGDPIACHEVIDTIERDFMTQDGLHMLVHYDPIPMGDSVLSSLRTELSRGVKFIDERITIHDLHIAPGPEKPMVRFDCEVPADVEIPEKEIRRMLCNLVATEYPGSDCDITIDRNYAALPH
jgi:cation diffusion facilitator family transporter